MTNKELENKINELTTQVEELTARLEEKEEELEEIKSNQVNKDEILDSFKRLAEAENMIQSGSSAPTYEPKTFLEQFYLYDDTTNQRLYIYQDGTWRYATLN